MDILLPVVWFFICIHVVQDQLKEDELLGDGTERVVKAEHVVSILSFNTGDKTHRQSENSHVSESAVYVSQISYVTYVCTPSDLR